jgi:hypothetical protein
VRSRIRWTALLPLSVLLMGAAEEKSATKKTDSEDDAYVLILTSSESNPEGILERYPEIETSWEELARFNLLRSGNPIELKREMLVKDRLLAKVAQSYGETEIRRSFDRSYMPVVKNLMLQEGDILRTWRKSGGRILFDDGNDILLKSNSRVRIQELSKADSSQTQARIELLEGSIWSRITEKVKGTFEFVTPSASTIIRGTDFRLKVEAGESTRLEVLDGTVEIESGGSSVAVPARKGVLTLSGEAPGTPKDIPPAPEALLEPQSEQVFRGESFDQHFRWSRVEGATGYRVEIARDSNFFDIVEERRTGAEPLVRILGLEPGTYFWRATALNESGFEGFATESSYFVVVRTNP